MELKSAMVGNGSIRFTKEVEPKPETKETNGNTTVVNAAQPGSPPYFDVSFMIDASFEASGLDVRNVFHWNVVILEKDHRAPYRSVEDRAARQIAPMLRALADKIEADLPNFDEPQAPA